MHPRELQEKVSPATALELLRRGNERFKASRREVRELRDEVETTSRGQWPFAVVLGCMDSRAAPELLFDLGIGDAFSLRVAGNIVNEDILGSLEFACKVAGAKLVVVLGHSRCGAIQGACEGVELGHLTALVQKVAPAVDEVVSSSNSVPQRSDPEFVDRVAAQNVDCTLSEIREQSPILADLEKVGAIGLIGAMYDVETGNVDFRGSESPALTT